MFLSYLESAHQKYEAVVHAYCLMSNYYHLMIETPSGNLPLIMKYINGSYTDWGTRGRRLNNHHSPPHCVRRELMLIDLRANSPPDGYSGNSPQREHRNALQILQRPKDANSPQPRGCKFPAAKPLSFTKNMLKLIYYN